MRVVLTPAEVMPCATGARAFPGGGPFLLGFLRSAAAASPPLSLLDPLLPADDEDDRRLKTSFFSSSLCATGGSRNGIPSPLLEEVMALNLWHSLEIGRVARPWLLFISLRKGQVGVAEMYRIRQWSLDVIGGDSGSSVFFCSWRYVGLQCILSVSVLYGK